MSTAIAIKKRGQLRTDGEFAARFKDIAYRNGMTVTGVFRRFGDDILKLIDQRDSKPRRTKQTASA